MEQATVVLHTDFQVGQVDARIYGGFVEHLGRGIYGGLYDPASALADENGFRRDVLAALRRLRFTAMRYPGGNFVSAYHWEDGIGPKAARPTTFEMAWYSLEPNQFGTDEFMRLAELAGWSPMMAVNLGTGSPEEARNWVEYCNAPVGTRYADRRRENGHAQPYGVALWCLGNEMDGPWQMGHGPAEHYAIRAQQAARMMKRTDPTIELVAAGSSGDASLPTYVDWDRQVLEYLGDTADYLSLHRYVGNPESDTANYLGATAAIDRQIEEIDAVCRMVQAKRRSRKRAYLAFDEWNVWYRTQDTIRTAPKAFPRPINEERYNLEDALVIAGFLNSFIRHADVVKIANLAQVVNVGAPILVEGDRLLTQTQFFALEMFAQRRGGVSLWPVVKGPRYATRDYGEAHRIDASAILGDGRLHVFLVNRGLEGNQPVTVELYGQQLVGVESAEILTGPGPQAMNTFDQPDMVVSRPLGGIAVEPGRAELALPPLSLAAITFKVAER